MGAIVSRWRKKPSTIEVLEDIDKDIKSIEKFKQHNLELQKKIIGSLLLYSILFYISAAVVFYFYYMPKKLQLKILYSLPLLFFPVLIWLIKKILHWYFVKRIASNDFKLEELKERRKTILEEVMEKETYKKAKEILERFDPEQYKKMEASPKSTPAPAQSPNGQELRQRPANGQAAVSPGLASPTPTPTPGQPVSTPLPPRPGTAMGRPMTGVRNAGFGRPPGPPMPRQILPRERSNTDKIIEYLVGDGPSNRYALICCECRSHNGMALKEEFEYLSFRCCYCFTFNEARKHRPQAPRPTYTPMTSRGRTETERGSEDDEAEEADTKGQSSQESNRQPKNAIDKKTD
ncbi:endoplasmic reticulum junction formation protein lunapark [Lingula anatina]|uniref:Endoplasmic reticulum junction formation protein lunapark n=1 Tax=Lingula anatina TaxID=7574 RepID=A0A1S3JBP2_LINAN|nr:endoplasmic reticulum junction formation protein lunapark [Lingula anatina]|eukprot:XP_013407606.1 endoplasmic reticulum junction formation protein lunapark [Lingula anatina]